MAALLIIFSHRLAQIEKTWFWGTNQIIKELF